MSQVELPEEEWELIESMIDEAKESIIDEQPPFRIVYPNDRESPRPRRPRKSA